MSEYMDRENAKADFREFVDLNRLSQARHVSFTASDLPAVEWVDVSRNDVLGTFFKLYQARQSARIRVNNYKAGTFSDEQ